MAWDAEQPPTPRPSDAELAAWAEIDDAAPLVNGRPFDSKWIFQATNRLANVTRSQPLTLWRARPAFHPQGGGPPYRTEPDVAKSGNRSPPVSITIMGCLLGTWFTCVSRPLQAQPVAPVIQLGDLRIYEDELALCRRWIDNPRDLGDGFLLRPLYRLANQPRRAAHPPICCASGGRPPRPPGAWRTPRRTAVAEK